MPKYNIFVNWSLYHRRLWQTVNKLLNRKYASPLPSSSAATSIADRFASFFTDKISKLRLSLSNNSSSTSPQSPSPPVAPPYFSIFKPTSEYEVSKIFSIVLISSLILILSPFGSWKNVLLSLSPQSRILSTCLWALVIFTHFSNSLLSLLFLKNPS